MSRQTVCDICNESFNHPRTFLVVKPFSVIKFWEGDEWSRLDVCHSCFEEFEKFIAEKREVKLNDG